MYPKLRREIAKYDVMTFDKAKQILLDHFVHLNIESDVEIIQRAQRYHLQ